MTSRILEVDAAVVIEVVHPPIAVVVDDDVRCVAELVATRARSAFGDEPRVVVRRAESAQDAYAVRRTSLRFHRLEHELELVEQRFAEHDVLRPHVVLVVREEVVEPEMLRQTRVAGCRA